MKKFILLVLVSMLSYSAFAQHMMFRNVEIDGNVYQFGKAINGEFQLRTEHFIKYRVKIGENFSYAYVFYVPSTLVTAYIEMELETSNEMSDALDVFKKYGKFLMVKYGPDYTLDIPDSIKQYGTIDNVNMAMVKGELKYEMIWKQDFGSITLFIKYNIFDNNYKICTKYLDNKNFEYYEQEWNKVKLAKTRDFLNDL